MKEIKKKEKIKGTIKTLDKGKIAIDKAKSNIVSIKERGENSYGNTNENNANEYAVNRLSAGGKFAVYNSSKIKTRGNEAVRDTKDNFIKTKNKIKTIKSKLTEKKNIKEVKKKIKTSKKIVKDTPKVIKQTVKTTERAKMLAVKTAKTTYKGIKTAFKATVSMIKGIIAGTKALISLLLAGGWVALIVIIVICLIGLLCGSIFGIFFSGEKTSPNAMSMQDAIVECNKEFSNKLETIQNSNPHDEYVLDGNMATWKNMLLIYAIKQTNGNNEQEIITMDNTKLKVLKDIFWDMNSLTHKTKTENITEQGINADEMPKEVEKKVLHIKITSKTAEEMKTQYNFNALQLEQYNELLKDDYSMLWNGIIYGIDYGEYVSWRQKGATWSNIRIGNTTSTIGDIGCLVTSVAILIQKSGTAPATLTPFNPGTFVEALNKNGGFDNKGNLSYAPINKIVPDFKYIGNINLRNKSREEKLELITKYFNDGYYLTVEVKGATEGNQHWVAIIGIDANNIVMVDPATNHTNMWSAYEWSKTTQFNYFKAN